MTFGVIDKVAGLLGSSEPLTWLTINRDSSAQPLYEIGGRIYFIDFPRKGRARQTRPPRRGTLSTGGANTDVTVTEVTDPTVKHQVVIAYAADKRGWSATGELKHREPPSFFVVLGLAKDDTPEGLAAAVPHVAVFEITQA